MGNVNVNISNTATFEKTYNIVTLKPGNYLELAESVNLEYTKYVIIYNFDLERNTLEIPANCILEINGGDFKNGTLKGNNTILINTNEVDILSNNLTKSGTWREVENIVYLPENPQEYERIDENTFIVITGLDGLPYILYIYNNLWYHFYNESSDESIKSRGLILSSRSIIDTSDYNIENITPLLAQLHSLTFEKGNIAIYGSNTWIYSVILPNKKKVILNNTKIPKKEVLQDKFYTETIPTLTQELFNQEGVTYVIRYDYTLAGETITIPPNCTLLFDGGNISEGTLKSENIVNELGEEIKNNTKIINPYKILIGANLVGKGFINLDYLHEILSEDDYEDLVLAEKTRDDTIYFIIES